MLATWLMELKLNVLEEAQNQAQLKNVSIYTLGVTRLEKDFFEFIEKQLPNLQEDTVFELL